MARPRGRDFDLAKVVDIQAGPVVPGLLFPALSKEASVKASSDVYAFRPGSLLAPGVPLPTRPLLGPQNAVAVLLLKSSNHRKMHTSFGSPQKTLHLQSLLTRPQG